MVRHYKCKGKDPKYTQEMFDTVQDMLKDGMSIRGVSKLFNIPYTTVNRWANNPNMTIGAGHPTVLSKEQEELIVIALETLSSWGPQPRQRSAQGHGPELCSGYWNTESLR